MLQKSIFPTPFAVNFTFRMIGLHFIVYPELHQRKTLIHRFLSKERVFSYYKYQDTHKKEYNLILQREYLFLQATIKKTNSQHLSLPPQIYLKVVGKKRPFAATYYHQNASKYLPTQSEDLTCLHSSHFSMQRCKQ